MITVNGKTFATSREARASLMASSAPPQAVAALSSAGPLVELAPASNKPEALTVRYRPRRLAQLQGQPEAVATLAEFMAGNFYAV